MVNVEGRGFRLILRRSMCVLVLSEYQRLVEFVAGGRLSCLEETGVKQLSVGAKIAGIGSTKL